MIVDTNAVSRTSIMKFLHTSGMPYDHITSVENFNDAKDILAKTKPEIIFAADFLN